MLLTFGPSSVVLIAAVCSAAASLLTLNAYVASDDHLDSLTFRLRHPLRWTLAHPVRAIRRRVSRA